MAEYLQYIQFAFAYMSCLPSTCLWKACLFSNSSPISNISVIIWFSHKCICVVSIKRVRKMQNAKERKNENTWILVYFCIGQLWRHSLAKLSNKEIDWHFSFVWLTHSKALKTTHQSTIYNYYSFYVFDFDLIILSAHTHYSVNKQERHWKPQRE